MIVENQNPKTELFIAKHHLVMFETSKIKMKREYN